MGFKYYWEDFPAGWRCEYGARTLTEDEIIAFASEWDPQRFHTNTASAKETIYGGIIASAWHTGATMMRLMCDAYLAESSCIGSPGIENWMFPLPVRPGDVLRYRATVLEARPSASKPDRGIVKWRWEMVNQRDEVVMSSIGTQFFLKRPQPTPR